MPTITGRTAATNANVISGNKNRYIGPRGAIVNFFASGVTKTDAVGLTINTRPIIENSSDINIEASADVVSCDGRDQLVFNEFVEEGELGLAIEVTTEMQWVLSIKPL